MAFLRGFREGASPEAKALCLRGDVCAFSASIPSEGIGVCLIPELLVRGLPLALFSARLYYRFAFQAVRSWDYRALVGLVDSGVGFGCSALRTDFLSERGFSRNVFFVFLWLFCCFFVCRFFIVRGVHCWIA